MLRILIFIGALLYTSSLFADGMNVPGGLTSCGSNVSGNMASWGSGCVNDPGLPAKGQQRVLGTLRAANFNSTADQAISIAPGITAFQLSSILVTNCSTSLTLAAGGFYTAASKGGTVLVLAATIYTALTGATVLSSLTIVTATLPVRYTLANIYLSLTTGQGSAATCDVYVIGTDLT
jgi:hypothetical protein